MVTDGVEASPFEERFAEALGDLARQGRVSQMACYPQHGRTSTLAHATRVARTSLRWARALRMHISERELVRGAMLHDYYLYDWHDPSCKGHALEHPLRALRNAQEDFDLSLKERNIIASHMWPLPLTRVPACREAWLVCIADKWCSMRETLRRADSLR